MITERSEPFGIVRMPQNLRDTGGLRARTREECGGDKLLFGHRLRRIIRRSRGIKPIVKP